MPLSRHFFFAWFAWLLLSSPLNAAAQSAYEDSGTVEQQSVPELVVGVPREGYPPFLYAMSAGHYAGPQRELTLRIAAEMGREVRYVPYASYVEAQQALIDGKVDALFGIPRDSLDHREVSQVGYLGSYDRVVLLREPAQMLTLEQAKKLRWVCVRGFGSCQILDRMGIENVTQLNSRDEASYRVKLGLADAYVGLEPALKNAMEHMSGPLGIVNPEWLQGTVLTIAIRKGNIALRDRLLEAYQRVPITDSRLRLGRDESPVSLAHLLDEEERAWLKKREVVRFAVAPAFAGISEIDKEGVLHGYAADLMKLLSLRTGIRFELTPTDSWTQSLELLRRQQVDLIPLITVMDERRGYASFTSPFLMLNSYVVAKRGSKNLASLADLRGHRVGGVVGSYESSVVNANGGILVHTSTDNELLSMLDDGRADYVLLTMTNIGRQAMQGFNDKYQVVYASSQFGTPVSMAVAHSQPELTRIMDKLLLTISDDEWALLERKWLNISINMEQDNTLLYRWLAFSLGGVVVIGALAFIWVRSLRRQIAQRQRAEQKLNEQLVFVQTLLDSLPNMVALRDRQQTLTLCNKAYRETFIGAELGDGWSNMRPDEREQMLREERQIWATGEIIAGAGQSSNRDGTLFHVIYVKLPYRAADGSIQGVLTVLTDVSAIKAAESKVREAETRLKDMTDSMPGVVYQYLWQGVGKGRFLYVSRGAEEILGKPAESLLQAQPGGAVFDLGEEMRQAFVSEVAAHAMALTPLDLEVMVPSPAGTRYLQVRGNFVPQESGDLILNGVVQDITTLKQQELELREARASAEQAMQARSRFLATMSHELRTPISGMHGMLELLRMSSLDEDQRYLLRNVESSTNNLLYLVNDILDFSKMEAGQFQLDYHPGRLQSVICDVIRGHAAQAYGKGLKVTLHWEAQIPDQAVLDAIRVGQVISNLLSNAVKFTEQGSIGIRVGYRDGALTITVSDTGIGIAEEKQGLLFTPFEQVESDINRRFGGTGLGLAICDQLVRKMGGTLSLTSRAGEGASFCFTIPLSDCRWDAPALAGSHWCLLSDEPLLQATMTRFGATLHPIDGSQLDGELEGLLLADEQSLERALGSEWQRWLQHTSLKGIVISPREALRGRLGTSHWWRLGQSPLYPDLLLETCRDLLADHAQPSQDEATATLDGRVLVADDHPVNRALLVRQLAILGVDCEVVDNGEQALRAWQGQHFALLLTDCHMPVMDGYTLARTLRSQGEQAPIIGVTADASEEATQSMTAAGMNGMLIKPYALESLRKLLIKWLPASGTNAAEPADSTSALEQASRWRDLFGDEALACTMAREYLASNQADCREMMAATAARNTRELMEIAHRIKGAARMVGEAALAEQAARLESAARLKQLDELEALAAGVNAAMHEVTREMGLWIHE
ncbi:ATP-binding protein [Aeromonas enteropelogenes]|uniref:ATP-binding protein n=1 Tax=Aeromonas enteropelogenes TaxID=29489 RepID=UPI003BA2B59B